MVELDDRLRGLLSQILSERGSIPKATVYFATKRSTIYRWMNGKTKSVHDNIYILILRMVKSLLSDEDYKQYLEKIEVPPKNVFHIESITTFYPDGRQIETKSAKEVDDNMIIAYLNMEQNKALRNDILKKAQAMAYQDFLNSQKAKREEL